MEISRKSFIRFIGISLGLVLTFCFTVLALIFFDAEIIKSLRTDIMVMIFLLLLGIMFGFELGQTIVIKKD